MSEYSLFRQFSPSRMLSSSFSLSFTFDFAVGFVSCMWPRIYFPIKVSIQGKLVKDDFSPIQFELSLCVILYIRTKYNSKGTGKTLQHLEINRLKHDSQSAAPKQMNGFRAPLLSLFLRIDTESHLHYEFLRCTHKSVAQAINVPHNF